jgi:hypothetical protein
MAEYIVPDHYLSDTVYHRLVDALAGLDRDPVHPEPLHDRITAVLGEIGGVWPTLLQSKGFESPTMTK